MKITNVKWYVIVLFFTIQNSFSQEGVAVYSDYLSDNLYLLHPSMAGAANCTKLRATARQQWFDQNDAPSLQTISFNTSLSEQSGFGVIAFNDKNGYHSQRGGKLTYAHHLLFSRDRVDVNQLSFGMNVGAVNSILNESSFVNMGFDPVIFGGTYQQYTYFNVDIGASYNFLDFSAHFTVKNLMASRREIYTEGIESDNLRKYIASAAYSFGDVRTIAIEPSLMFQFTEYTREKALDINVKAYKKLEEGKIWGGVSYRNGFDGANYTRGAKSGTQRLQYITPIVGINYKNFMVAYTYSYLSGNVKFDNLGFHQITIGLDLFCKKEKYDCNCPAVN